MVEEPFQRRWLHGFTGREDDWEVPIPEGVHIRAARHEKLHHGNAVADKRGSHQRPVATLVNVGPMIDHPFGHCESRGTRRPPRDATLRDPSEGPVFTVAKRSPKQSRVASHEVLDAIEIICVDGLLELADLLEGIDMTLELRPTGEPIETGDLELRVSERVRTTGFEEILGLLLQVAKIGTFGKRAKLLRESADMRPPLLKAPVVRISGRKKVRKDGGKQVGFYPFRGPDASLTQE
jgi:hypothetical protein